MKKISRAKKILLGTLMVILGLICLIVFILITAFRETPDGNRITTETNVRMLVDLPGSSPSAAMTKSFDAAAFNDFSESKKMDYRCDVTGKVEGDIPCVFIDKRKNSRVSLRFQDDGYTNIKPKINSITLYTAPGMPVSPEKRKDKRVRYNSADGVTDIYLFDFLRKGELSYSDSEEEKPQVMFCIFEVRYTYGGRSYASLTSVSVLDKK